MCETVCVPAYESDANTYFGSGTDPVSLIILLLLLFLFLFGWSKKA